MRVAVFVQDGWWLLVVVVIYSGGGRACAARHGLTGDVVRRTNSICEYIQSKDCLFLSFSFAPVYLLYRKEGKIIQVSLFFLGGGEILV